MQRLCGHDFIILQNNDKWISINTGLQTILNKQSMQKHNWGEISFFLCNRKKSHIFLFYFTSKGMFHLICKPMHNLSQYYHYQYRHCFLKYLTLSIIVSRLFPYIISFQCLISSILHISQIFVHQQENYETHFRKFVSRHNYYNN